MMRLSNDALLRIAGETARFGGWQVDLADNLCTWSDKVADIHDMPRGCSPFLPAGKFSSLHPVRMRLFMSGYTADVTAHHGVPDNGVHFTRKPFPGRRRPPVCGKCLTKRNRWILISTTRERSIRIRP